jgi:hypothetical protein
MDCLWWNHHPSGYKEEEEIINPQFSSVHFNAWNHDSVDQRFILCCLSLFYLKLNQIKP